MLNSVLEKHRIGKKSERREIVLELLEEAKSLAGKDYTKAYLLMEGANVLYYDLLYGHDSKIHKKVKEISDYVLRSSL